MAPGAAVIEHPNRDKPASRSTRVIVVALMLASAALLAIVTVGGWTRIQGAKPVQIAYVLLYLVLAYYIARWRSGLLPVAAALAIVLLMFAAISAPGWFDRDQVGFTDPALDSAVLGVLTIVLVPVQILLIVFAAKGFAQRWSVEIERDRLTCRAYNRCPRPGAGTVYRIGSKPIAREGLWVRIPPRVLQEMPA